MKKNNKIENEVVNIAAVNENGFEGAEVDMVENANDVECIDEAPEEEFEEEEVDTSDITAFDEDEDGEVIEPEVINPDDDIYIDVDEILAKEKKYARFVKRMNARVEAGKMTREAADLEIAPVGAYVNEYDNGEVYSHKVVGRPDEKTLEVVPFDNDEVVITLHKKGKRYTDGETKAKYFLALEPEEEFITEEAEAALKAIEDAECAALYDNEEDEWDEFEEEMTNTDFETSEEI